MKTELKYRTFDELMDDVGLDLHTYSDEGMIQSAQLIKVAQRVTYDLGLRIHTSKLAILDIENGKARLPDDFYVLNYARLVYKYKVPVTGGMRIDGLEREDVLVATNLCSKCHKPDDIYNPCYQPDTCCICNKLYTNECGQSFAVVEKKHGKTRYYDEFHDIRLKMGKHVDKLCMNTHVRSEYTGELKNGYLYTNVGNGKVVISYEGSLEDEDGNLLVLDHPMINDYYENAIKQRIFENMYLNGEDVAQRLQLIEQRLQPARRNALSIVNTPDFKDIKDIHDLNRKAMYHKYYSMFVH